VNDELPQVGLVLWTTDIGALARFFEQVCGLETVDEFPGFARLHAWNAAVELHSDDDADRRHPWYNALRREGAARGIGSEVRIRVASVDAAYQAAVRLGALAIQPPIDSGQTAYHTTIMGPDGYLFTIYE
jgi:hypothetical protein